MKTPSTWSKEGKVSKACQRTEVGETSDGEIPEVKKEEAYADQGCSESCEGL